LSAFSKAILSFPICRAARGFALVSTYYFSLLKTFMRQEKESDPDPHL